MITIRNARLLDGRIVDIGIEDERISCLGTLWISKVVFDIPDLILPLFFLAYLGINYAIIKI